MSLQLFQEFVSGSDTLRIYDNGRLVFSSHKDRLLPLLEYLENPDKSSGAVTVMDKIAGNAAALLSIKAGCREVYSPLGSHLAVETMNKYGVKYHITRLVPRIMKADGKDICPMEKMSVDKTPDEFYEVMKALTSG